MRVGIDPDVLRRFLGDDPEMERGIVEDFVSAAQSAISEIHAAVDAVLAEQVERVSHKLKGSSSLVGAYQLMEVCAQLEVAGENGDWPTVHQLNSRLDELMSDVERSAAVFLGSPAVYSLLSG